MKPDSSVMVSKVAVPAPVYSCLAADPILGELVDLFAEEMPDRIAVLDSLAKSQDWKQLARTAHQLKGAAGSYGFDQITPIVARLEAAARDGRDENEILSALNELLSLCKQAHSGLPTPELARRARGEGLLGPCRVSPHVAHVDGGRVLAASPGDGGQR
jgi:HPt (histidine-containing phosphotransfer) domain-containing protein